MELLKSLEFLMRLEKDTNYQSWDISEYEVTDYSPEKAQWFDIKSYWYKVEDFDIFIAESPNIKYFQRNNEILFLIHPEMEDFYRQLKGTPGPVFKGLATSSYRTVLLYHPDFPHLFVKLSLNKILSNASRIIKKNEIIRSITGTNILQRDDFKSLENFRYFPEIMGIIPKKIDAGMIIREIPNYLLEKNIELFPLFSLFPKADTNDLTNQNINIYDSNWLKLSIIRPFVKQYFYLLINKGILTEPHAQNLLIEF